MEVGDENTWFTECLRLVGQSYPFSFVLTIEQKHSAELDGHSLYDGLELVNDVEVIAQAALEAEA